ncbi:MAG: hypothetical protein H0V17_31280 [Deltaproteobacteria bacterium]|nr:hypothetical protein [Deltaproteobacteria bacterium]
MSDPLVSDVVFKWAGTIITGSVAGTWLIYDAYKLLRLAKADGTDPTVHDKRFGYSIGVLIGFIGVWGCLRFHGVV